jgi:hypothetical protein
LLKILNKILNYLVKFLKEEKYLLKKSRFKSQLSSLNMINLKIEFLRHLIKIFRLVILYWILNIRVIETLRHILYYLLSGLILFILSVHIYLYLIKQSPFYWDFVHNLKFKIKGVFSWDFHILFIDKDNLDLLKYVIYDDRFHLYWIKGQLYRLDGFVTVGDRTKYAFKEIDFSQNNNIIPNYIDNCIDNLICKLFS